MAFFRLYFDYPKTALVAHSLCAAALGYISSTIQKVWYAEDFTLLHISLWWVGLFLLLLWDGERLRRRRPEGEPPRADVPPGCHRHVLFRAAAKWSHEIRSEELSPDFPPGGPLFRWICLKLPQPWGVDAFTISVRLGLQDATIDRAGTVFFVLDFGPADGKWHLSVSILPAAKPSDVRRFLLDLHQAIASTDGVSDVRWYRDEDLEERLPDEIDESLGIDSPIE